MLCIFSVGNDSAMLNVPVCFARQIGTAAPISTEAETWQLRPNGTGLDGATAETADEAIKVATEQFGLNPERAKRLVAQREG